MKTRTALHILFILLAFVVNPHFDELSANTKNDKCPVAVEQVLSQQEIADLESCIRHHENFVLTCHVSPDGDAIGSSLGLMHVLKAMGKNVQVVAPDFIRESLKFLPGANSIIEYPRQTEKAKMAVDNADCIICLDFNTLNRIGEFGPIVKASKADKVMIDHHLNPEKFCGLTISYSEMSSTCELVYRALLGIGATDKINSDAAECMYTGLMTDTGNFAYASSDPNTFRVAAELLEKGFDKDRIYQLAMNTSSLNRLKFMGYIFQNNITVFPESNGALMTVSGEDLAHFNCKHDDTVGLANIPLQIPEVQWSIFLIEDAGKVYVSARSCGDFPVNTICAKYFNGGGHKNAAGGSVNGTLKDAIGIFHKLEAEIKTQKKQEKNNL